MSQEAKGGKFCCDICNEDFQSRCKLRKHICLTENLTETSSTTVEMETVAKPLKGENVHSSKNIQMTTENTQKEEMNNALQDASNKRENAKAEDSKEEIWQNRLQIANSNQEEEKTGEFSCDICSQDFKSQFEILKHICLASKGTKSSETLVEREMISKTHNKKISHNIGSKKGKIKDKKHLEYSCEKCSFSSQIERLLTIHMRKPWRKIS